MFSTCPTVATERTCQWLTGSRRLRLRADSVLAVGFFAAAHGFRHFYVNLINEDSRVSDLSSPASPLSIFLTPLATSLLSALLLNVYVVGLNQMTDVPIDRVKKPHLPLASGAMTIPGARAIISITLFAGLSFCLLPFPLATPPLAL